MERLTKIDGIGENEMIRCFDCNIEVAGNNLENCGYCDHWQKVIDRLAVYEASGLMPEEVVAMQHTMAEYHKEADPLLRAKAEGRLVVLPCKVGDTVFIPHYEKGVVAVRVQGISISVSGRTILRFGGYPFESAWGDGCGKDWFLTREEAEKALGGAIDG